MSFEENTIDKDEYSSFNIAFDLSTRLTASIGRVFIGGAAVMSWSDMNLLRNLNSGSDNTFSQYAYGPYIGIAITPEFRLDLEYYTSAQHEIMYAEGKSTNPFTKGDTIDETGFGVGLTSLNGNTILGLIFRNFTPSESTIGGTTYDSNDGLYRDFSTQSISATIGLMF